MVQAVTANVRRAHTWLAAASITDTRRRRRSGRSSHQPKPTARKPHLRGMCLQRKCPTLASVHCRASSHGVLKQAQHGQFHRRKRPASARTRCKVWLQRKALASRRPRTTMDRQHSLLNRGHLHWRRAIPSWARHSIPIWALRRRRLRRYSRMRAPELARRSRGRLTCKPQMQCRRRKPLRRGICSTS